MKYFSTIIKAIDPLDGELKRFSGPVIPAISFEDAEKYCQVNELGYCKVLGELIAVIPAKKDLAPDWKRTVDIEKVQMN